MNFLVFSAFVLLGCHNQQFPIPSYEKESTRTIEQAEEQLASDEVTLEGKSSDGSGSTDETDHGAVEVPHSDDPAPKAPDSHSSCSTGVPKTAMYSIKFPGNRGQSCEWGKNGNLPRDPDAANDSPTRAIRDEYQEIPIVPDTTICSMSISASEAGFIFDDYIMGTFAGLVLFASNYTRDELAASGMKDINGQMSYDRSYVIGKLMVSGEINARSTPQFCINPSECQIPRSDTAGRVEINIPLDWFEKAGSDGMRNYGPKFGLHTNGQGKGNDGVNDCTHSPIEFQVKVNYVGEK